MNKPALIQSIRQKFESVRSVLHERGRRIWAAAEARQIGWGGETLVEEATGITRKTIRRGMREIETEIVVELTTQRSRVPGAGRKNMEDIYPGIREELDALIDPVTRGDPESPLRWTCKSIRRLADELQKIKIDVSPNSVRALLHEMEYSLQANRKTREGTDHPDRNEQFLYINDKVKSFLHADQPVVSVDTKKKENLGNFSNKGHEWSPQGRSVETNMHAPFKKHGPDKELGKAIPYGVYDIAKNEGWVNIGINHDTARFAANSIRRWWTEMGQHRFPHATRLLITADAGGSNGHRTKLWKVALRELSNDIQLNITVCHFPPGQPSETDLSFEVIKYLADRIPILGVGFGHQAIIHAFGGEIIRARKTMHGKTSQIQTDGCRLFKGISGSFEAMRYHSHVACRKTLPESLLVTAESEEDHEIMGIRHREYPVEGIQFHPESIMTTVGKRLLRNFLKITNKEWL